MGGSSKIPTLHEVVPESEAVEEISHLDETVRNFLRFEFAGIELLNQRYDIIISCLKTLSSFMDLNHWQEDVLNQYEKSSQGPKIKIFVTHGLTSKGKEYRDIVRKATNDLKVLWEEALKTFQKKILPRATNLLKDVTLCIRDCKKYTKIYNDPNIPVIYKDPIIYMSVQNGILMMLEYTFAGLCAMKKKLQDTEQPRVYDFGESYHLPYSS